MKQVMAFGLRGLMLICIFASRGFAVTATSRFQVLRLKGGEGQDTLLSGRRALIVPSILAADFSKLGSEAAECSALGIEWLHVDICDGLGGHTITLGPEAVSALKRSSSLFLDCHLTVYNDIHYVESIAAAGAGRFSFQWELLGKQAGLGDDQQTSGKINRLDAALKIAEAVIATGMKCGVAIGRATPLEEVAPFLDKGIVDYVNCLAVEPGLGGQKMDANVLDKVRLIRQRYPDLPYLAVRPELPDCETLLTWVPCLARGTEKSWQVDGGVNFATAQACAEAGANVLVAGSCIFGGERRAAVEKLRATLLQHGD